MSIVDIVTLSQWFFIFFFISINAFYLLLSLFSLIEVSKYRQWQDLHTLPQIISVNDFPISILAPAYNEEQSIVSSVRSLLQLNYPVYEIIVINDGSSDNTFQKLSEAFGLIRSPECREEVLKTNKVKEVYISKKFPNLKVINKENGGKADALNVGLNYSRYPLFCCVDADSVLERNSLQRVIEPFLANESTIASGGTIRIANGCEVSDGHLKSIALPKSTLSLFQVIEYLRAFLFGRMGWSAINGMLIISGAFGVFRKSIVVEAGGYHTNTIGEDMELVVRLHRYMKLIKREPYKIKFVPDPICWTEAPEDLRTLKNQRVRWQRGLFDSLYLNKELFLNIRSGVVGWVAYPFLLFFECLEPFIQCAGYILTALFYYYGLISTEAFILFYFCTIGLGILLSTISFFLEEISFHVYPKTKDSIIMYFGAILENFGYRQLNSIWRLKGLLDGVAGKRGQWGEMKRLGRWQK